MSSARKTIMIPQPRPMELPSSSGLKSDWFTPRTPEEIVSSDADFVEQHARFLAARGDQAQAAGRLVEARLTLGLAIARLGALPDLVREEHIAARTARAHQQRMADLTYLTEQLEAQSRMLEAKHRRDALIPKPLPAPEPAAPGLSPGEIEANLAMMPDLEPELRAAIRRILEAALDEKRKQ